VRRLRPQYLDLGLLTLDVRNFGPHAQRNVQLQAPANMSDLPNETKGGCELGIIAVLKFIYKLRPVPVVQGG
jgi:hypothetical protein